MDWNTLAGVALGAGLTYTIQKLIRQDDKALNARLALTGTLGLLWEAESQVLRKQLHRVRVQLEQAGVDENLIESLEEAAWACWFESNEHAEAHHDPEVGHVITVVKQRRRRESCGDPPLLGCPRNLSVVLFAPCPILIPESSPSRRFKHLAEAGPERLTDWIREQLNRGSRVGVHWQASPLRLPDIGAACCAHRPRQWKQLSLIDQL